MVYWPYPNLFLTSTYCEKETSLRHWQTSTFFGFVTLTNQSEAFLITQDEHLGERIYGGNVKWLITYCFYDYFYLIWYKWHRKKNPVSWIPFHSYKKSRHALFYNTTLLWHKQFWLVLLHVQSVTKYTTNWNAVIISGIITNNTRLSSCKFHEGQPIYIKCATMKKLLVFQRRAVTPIILCFIRVHNL